MAMCIVLLGPIMGADREYHDGEMMELSSGDSTALAGWGIVRPATEAEAAAASPPQEPVAAKTTKAAADKLAAEKLAADKPPAT